jgi:hypothetical protein
LVDHYVEIVTNMESTDLEIGYGSKATKEHFVLCGVIGGLEWNCSMYRSLSPFGEMKMTPVPASFNISHPSYQSASFSTPWPSALVVYVRFRPLSDEVR